MIKKRKARIRHHNQHRIWTDSEIDTLMEMLSNANPIAEIAAKLNRTYYAVQGKLKNMRLSLQESAK